MFHHPVLLRLGHAEHEITELTATFARFDQDGNRVLDEKEQEQMRQDLEEQRVSPAGWWRGSIRKLLTLPPCQHAQNTNPNCKPSNGWAGKSSLASGSQITAH